MSHFICSLQPPDEAFDSYFTEENVAPKIRPLVQVKLELKPKSGWQLSQVFYML